MSSYDDIINLPRPTSKHKRMSLYNRAAQFSPFAALVGYDEVIEETGRKTDERIELNEDQSSIINNKLVYLNGNRDIEAKYECFLKDKRKEGGSYIYRKGKIRKLDLDKGIIVLDSNDRIVLEDIVEITII